MAISINDIKIEMINRYGKSSFEKLATEIGCSRQSIYACLNNKGAYPLVYKKIEKWLKG